jgi:AcrR family transcriptional regulator
MSEAGHGSRRRPGRPAGSPPNEEAILAAAREQFAQRGYEQASIRAIAAGAGVDPALVHHYFGSKERLFAAAVRLPIVPSEVIPGLVADGPDGLGERMLRTIVELWASHADVFVGLVRSATSNEEAARMFREFLQHHFVGPVAEALGVPQPQLRAALVSSQFIGLQMARHIFRLEPIASADPETLVACYAPALQRCMTGPLPGDGDDPPGEADVASDSPSPDAPRGRRRLQERRRIA